MTESAHPAGNAAGNMPGNVSVPYSLASAARFWEPRRLVYNFILTAIVTLWVVGTWPHFRPALTLSTLGAFTVLALLANVCYCAAYFADIAIQHLLPNAVWARLRWALWMAGTLFAIVLENYWIADEIYPDFNRAATDLPREFNVVWTPHIASNMNFPAPLAVLGFLAASLGLFASLVAILVAWFTRKPKFVRTLATLVAIGAIVYLGLLFGFSLSSHSNTLARGQEKYFCEIDCHLAYSIVDVTTASTANTIHYLVTVRTRFDETTISPSRPKDTPLTPNPRIVRLIEQSGREYLPTAVQGTPLLTPLKPADSYTTRLQFDAPKLDLPKDAAGPRLLLTTSGAEQKVIIGDENSLLHKKTYFGL